MGASGAKSESPKTVDVVGIGINATDTIIRLPHFPALDSKVEIISSEMMPGGQVASAIVACRRWGLRTRYVGKVGEDAAAQLQMDEMENEQVDARWIIAPGRDSQTSYILVDESSGRAHGPMETGCKYCFMAGGPQARVDLGRTHPSDRWT